MGIGGAASGGDYLAFVERTGTDGFTQLQDTEAGELWDRFGTGGRSTFMFIQEDGSFELTTYGVVDKSELESQVQRLINT